MPAITASRAVIAGTSRFRAGWARRIVSAVGVVLSSLVLISILAGCGNEPEGPVLVSSSDDVQAGVADGGAADGGADSGSDPQAPADGADGGAGEAEGDGSSDGPPPFTIVAQAVSDSVTARVEPDEAAAVVAELANPTAIGGPLVFRAVDGRTDPTGQWIQVQLPIQPNGTTGWIPTADVSLSDNPFRIEIDRAGFNLRVFRQNSLWLEAPIAVGTGDTPTPVGDFYLMELLSPPDPTGPYGPYAFGLSGFSEVLDSFGGADQAIIGLHGTNDPGSLGTNVSHGCIRIENSIIEQLATTVPLGTPVVIT